MLHPMPFRFFSFSMLIATGAVLGHLYLYRRLGRDTVRGRALRLLALAVLLLLTLVLLLRRTLRDALPVGLSDALSVASYTWMGVALLLIFTLLVLDLGRPTARPSTGASPEERRRFLRG